MMAICLPDARELSKEVLEVLRLRALYAIELGFTEIEVAAILGVRNETVCRWWTAYIAGGVEALPQDHRGRPLGFGRFLSDEQASHIRSLIDIKTPEELEIVSALWTRKAVGELIRKEFRIDLADRTVGEYLRRWNYMPKKPRRHARKQNPKELARRLKKSYPAVEKKAAKENAENLRSRMQDVIWKL
jgi:transposase